MPRTLSPSPSKVVELPPFQGDVPPLPARPADPDLPYRVTTLPNGARIATVEMPHMRSVSLGFWVGVGGRHESREECGLSHFIEHLLFKGTETRTAKQISEQVEGLGGYLNAFTTEDHTCYYARAGARHLPKLCDVLSDMFLHSRFAQAEIEREREVVREEILSYRDQPEQHASDLLTETMWPKHPLGRPLTGTVESIVSFPPAADPPVHEAALQCAKYHRGRGRTGLTRGGSPVAAPDSVRSSRRAGSRVLPAPAR